MSGIDFLLHTFFLLLVRFILLTSISALRLHQVELSDTYFAFGCLCFFMIDTLGWFASDFRYRISKNWCESFPEDIFYVFCFLLRAMCLALENWLFVRKKCSYLLNMFHSFRVSHLSYQTVCFLLLFGFVCLHFVCMCMGFLLLAIKYIESQPYSFVCLCVYDYYT